MKYIKIFENFNNNKKYYFLRWTSSPQDDIKRNFSGHMQTWVDSEEEAISKREEEEKEGRYFENDIMYDESSGMYNYDPEWGISGYLFTDEDSFNDAMSEIEDIAWHHRDNNQQDLALFSAKEIGSGSGYDGEELFRDLTFIDYIDIDDDYEEVKNKIES